VYDEKNNQNKYNKKQYNKTRSKVYIVKKQDDNKNINNEKVKNSFKVKKHESDYYVMKEFDYYIMNLNINFYEVNVYNQKKEKEKSKVNFVVILITII